MTASPSMREQWSSVVDAVACMNSTDALPLQYNTTQFLPGQAPLPSSLCEALRRADGGYDAAAAAHYGAQVTVEESCHAKPTLPSFSSSPHETSFTLQSGGRGDSHNNNNNNNNNNNSNNNNNNSEGPDFYSTYKLAVASNAAAAAAASSSSSSRARHARGDYSLTRGAGAAMTQAGGSRWRRQSTRADVLDAADAAPLARLTVASPSRLASGLRPRRYYEAVHRQPDFMPVILVPAAVTAPLQLLNISSFLEQGVYVDPTSLFVDQETGAVYVADVKPESVVVCPGSFLDRDKYRVAFRHFRVVDDVAQVRDWSLVCACLVEGRTWQFSGWFPDEPASACVPSQLFRRLRGFLPYFEEDKVPVATQQWRVQPLLLTRRAVKAHQHILQASVFWEQLYTFLDEHPRFRWYTVRPDA